MPKKVWINSGYNNLPQLEKYLNTALNKVSEPGWLKRHFNQRFSSPQNVLIKSCSMLPSSFHCRFINNSVLGIRVSNVERSEIMTKV